MTHRALFAPTQAAIAMLAALTWMSGCAVGPNFHPPAAPPGAGYSVEPLPTITSSAPVPGGDAQSLEIGAELPFDWWRLFGSRELDALETQALRANPTIDSARAALRQAEELVSAQRGLFFPTIDAGYSFERQKLAGNLSGSSAPGVQGNGQSITATQNPGGPVYNQPLYYNFQTAELTVGFLPDVFGSNRRQVESLAAQADAQRFNLEATYLTLAANVAGAAIQEASVRAQIAAVRRIIAADEASLHILRDQHRLGYATGIDVAAAEAALAQAETLLPPLDKQLEQTLDLLRALLGQLPNDVLPTAFELDSLSLPHALPVSVPAKLIEQRPDVRLAQAQLHSANAQVGVAVAAMLPQFPITGTVGGTATQFDYLFRSGGPFWDVIASVSQPVFHGGTLWHQKRAADQALHEAAAQYSNAVIVAYQNVADSLHAVQSDADALTAAWHAESSAKVTLDLTNRQLAFGYVGVLTLLNAQASYEQALLNRLQAQATRFGDTIALFQSLGGGWWNRDQPSLAASALAP